ncbi:type II toxin-antitoxin system PemK/MazF family toxin [Dietzia aurantiaca]|uniref:Type II toxin-antitoxin system PemK/MazF family toxin n=1 Tax=Dietzia aurantiaca TaxID=983873 RepID=A0ABV9PN01_9ACTN
MRRGEIWTASGPGCAGNSRPVVIVQDDRFDATASVVVCPLTTNPTEAPLFRPAVEPSPLNGLTTASRLMVDKLTAAPRDRVRERVGTLEPEHLVTLERSMIVFLGMAD